MKFTHHLTNTPPLYSCVSLCVLLRSLNTSLFLNIHNFFLELSRCQQLRIDNLKMFVCFLAFTIENTKKFIQAAIDIGCVLVKRKIRLAYVGGDQELSRLLSKVADTRGSQVLGIIPKA